MDRYFTTLIRLAMITYQVIYRLPDEDKHWFFIKADSDEDAAYEALDWTKTRKYNLIDVRRIT